MMTDVADKLREARALVAKGWTQDANARGKSGRPVSTFGRAATCFCAGGALLRVSDGYGTTLLRSAVRSVVGKDGIIEDWNDAPERTQAEVLAAFDKAIALAEAAQ